MWNIIREQKRHLKNGVCICMVHVQYRCAHMRHISTCTHEDVHTCKTTKRSLPQPQQWQERKETSNMYKLGAVSITMYINSHTSF